MSGLGWIAQSVEQRTENPCVGGLIPSPATTFKSFSNMKIKDIFRMGSFAVAVAIVSGCASSGVKNPSGVPVTEMKADERGFVAGTGVESQDLVAVTDKMARSILGV